MKTFLSSMLLMLSLGVGVSLAGDSCLDVVRRINRAAKYVKVDSVKLLELVDKEISEHPDCSCEIVKAAILGVDCDDAMVGYIVETAITASPENMRMIAQCAIAVAPDSLARVQEVLNRLDPSSGESGNSGKRAVSGKSGKDAKETIKPAAGQPIPNPLDYIFVPPILPPPVTPIPVTPGAF